MTERTQRKRVILADLCGGQFIQTVLRGVNRYAREHGRWIVTQSEDTAAGVNALLRTWRPDGVLLRGFRDFATYTHHMFADQRLARAAFEARVAAAGCDCISIEAKIGV